MSRIDEFKSRLQKRVCEDPNAIAVRFKNTHLTYGELDTIRCRLLGEFGPLAGCRVVLLLPDSLGAYLLYLHLFLEGATIVPVSPLLTAQRIADICARSHAHLVITNDFLASAYRQQLAQYPCMRLRESRGDLRFDLDPSSRFKKRSAGDTPDPVRMIIFTSGSTGVPKGVCLSEDNLLSAAAMMVDFLPLTPSTVSMVTVPLYDYYGMIQIFGHILGGGWFVFGPTAAMPSSFFAALSEANCTDLVLVPHTLRGLLRTREAHALRSIQRITSSSDALTEELLQQLFAVAPDATLVNIYGLTEAGRAVYRQIDRTTPFSRSVGSPSKGVSVEIAGSKDSPGEIVIRGPNVMLGYLREVQNERLCFDPCTEMRTGDLGYFDETGGIVLLGRADHMINLMGLKIHPDEIESQALQMPGILDARAAVERTNGEATIRLEIVCAEDRLTIPQVLDWIRPRVPRAFVPRHIEFVPRIRRTEIGAKILR